VMSKSTAQVHAEGTSFVQCSRPPDFSIGRVRTREVCQCVALDTAYQCVNGLFHQELILAWFVRLGCPCRDLLIVGHIICPRSRSYAASIAHSSSYSFRYVWAALPRYVCRENYCSQRVYYFQHRSHKFAITIG